MKILLFFVLFFVGANLWTPAVGQEQHRLMEVELGSHHYLSSVSGRVIAAKKFDVANRDDGTRSFTNSWVMSLSGETASGTRAVRVDGSGSIVSVDHRYVLTKESERTTFEKNWKRADGTLQVVETKTNSDGSVEQLQQQIEMFPNEVVDQDLFRSIVPFVTKQESQFVLVDIDDVVQFVSWMIGPCRAMKIHVGGKAVLCRCLEINYDEVNSQRFYYRDDNVIRIVDLRNRVSTDLVTHQIYDAALLTLASKSQDP